MRGIEVPLARGSVSSLCINGNSVQEVIFELDGPVGDRHSGFSRILSGHDGGYVRTSSLQKKVHGVFNWRSWTGISIEERDAISREVGIPLEPGDFQENILFSGIAGFTHLPPSSRIVFPCGDTGSQLILTVWEENDPCVGIGKPFGEKHNDTSLSPRFIKASIGRRGVMGFVLSAGIAQVGDEVVVYPPFGPKNL